MRYISEPRRREATVDSQHWRAVITAARAGDRRALDELVEGWLPLVYNIVAGP